jgi:hypothetical protein
MPEADDKRPRGFLTPLPLTNASALDPAELLGEIARHLGTDVDRRVLEQAQANVDETCRLVDRDFDLAVSRRGLRPILEPPPN